MGDAACKLDSLAGLGRADGKACKVPARGDKGTALLQQATKSTGKVLLMSELEAPLRLTPRREPFEVVATVPTDSGPLPLCHPAIVTSTCYNLNGGQQGAENVTRDQIQDLASLNETTVDHLWDSLKLADVGTSVPCALLCSSVVEFVKAHGILPPSSDRACYTVDGRTSCKLDVAPPKLVEETAGGADYRPDGGFRSERPSSVSGLVQRRVARITEGGLQTVKRILATATAAGTRGGEGEGILQEQLTFCPYSLWEAVELVANFFRIYPSRGQSVIVDGPGLALAQGKSAAAVADLIVNNNALARAWVSQVVVELSSWRTGPWRQEWFGGNGTKTEAQVRNRVVSAMNFIERELDTMRYVYPADDAVDTACDGNTAAYVWKSSSSRGQGYYETKGPLCEEGDSPLSKHCGVDSNGRYFVYLCKVWADDPKSWRISTLVHEAAHHTGPRDVSYDIGTMKQLSQSDQLDNAANYQHFAHEVANAAWGCKDSDTPSFPFSCDPGPCTCVPLAGYCQDSSFGESVRRECPMTCGTCDRQTPEPPPTPAPPAPPAPTPVPPPMGTSCSEPSTQVTLTLGGFSFTAYCSTFSAHGACQYPKAQMACPVSCGECDGPPGCQDDPTYRVQTQYGLWTCDSWRGYICWEEVKPLCPVSCAVEGCA